MIGLFDYDLAICFYLLQGGHLFIPYERNGISRVLLDDKFSYLEERINGLKRPPEKLFCRSERNGTYTISLLEPQKHLLKDFLQKYCSELVNNRIYDIRYQLGWTRSREYFIQWLLESDCDLSNYYTDSVFTMPLLAPDLMKLDYNMNIRVESIDSEHKEMSDDYLNYLAKGFVFECSLDLSSIVEKQGKPKSKAIEIEPKRKKFSRQQQKLYDFLERKAKGGKFDFAKYDLREFAPISGNGLSSAINRLNEQYQEIYCTEEKLIEFDRGVGKYILQNIWGYKTSD